MFVLHDEINFSEVGVLKIKLLELFTVYLSFVNLKETKTLIVRSLLVINVFRKHVKPVFTKRSSNFNRIRHVRKT